MERKGISDLFQSFQSGRLFNQAETMTKTYKYPCLLIEFSADRSFILQELTSEIQQHSVQSKLTVLTMAFPSLRVLWARHPTMTVNIFRSISMSHEEVDVDKAVLVGNVHAGDGIVRYAMQ